MICNFPKGGPQYELNISGKSSFLNYYFSEEEIDFGKVLFDSRAQREVILTNDGSVGFEYTVESLGLHDIPGKIALSPGNGFLKAHSSVTFTVSYIPGIPETFTREFWIKVSHFQV